MAGLGRVRRQRLLAVLSKPIGDDVAVGDPDVEEGPVPGLGRLDVVVDYPGSVPHMRAMVLRAACLGALAAVALPGFGHAATDPADQPPFGGAEVPPLVDPGGLDAQPAGFELDVHGALDLANVTPEARGFFGDGAEDDRRVDVTIATRGSDRWEVRYRRDGEIEALVIIDDRAGEVVEAWTGAQVETKLARGYEDAVAGDLNEWYVWIPLCLLFVAPFVFPRRLFRRLIHLDLIALLGFSASLFFFNKGEIGVSGRSSTPCSPTCWPDL